MHSCGFSFQLQLCTLILQFSFQHCLNELDGEDPVGIKQSIVSLTATRSCCGQCFDFIHCCLFLKWWVVGADKNFRLKNAHPQPPSAFQPGGPVLLQAKFAVSLRTTCPKLWWTTCLPNPAVDARSSNPAENRTCFHLQLCILVDSVFNFSCAL